MNEFVKKVIAKLKEKEKVITWVAPNLKDEVGEYLENPDTKKFFKSKGITFNTEKEVIDFLQKGKLTKITESNLTKTKNLDTESEYFDSNYQKSYKKMQKDLQKGLITLPAPIFIKTEDIFYLFSGNRRITLAVNNNIPIKVWMVQI